MKLFQYIQIFLILTFTSFNLYSSTLDNIKNRGFLKCGISEPHEGFANVNADNEWVGFDIDMCKAVSVAIFGSPNNVEYIMTTSRSRFPSLALGEIDLLSRMTTWTFSRDVNLEFEFTNINFYDGQGLMYKSSLNIKDEVDFDGSSVCIISGNKMSLNIDAFFKKNNINFKPVIVEFDDEAYKNFLSGRCDIYSNYITELSNKRILINNNENYSIFGKLISKEPLGILVRQGDDKWRDVVTWCFNVLVLAEEYGITSINIDDFLISENNEILSLLGVNPGYGDMIELEDSWSYNIIKVIGNYGEVFDRHLGRNSPVNLERGLNNLYSNNGLLYAPPFR